jgi:hypothetical protein
VGVGLGAYNCAQCTDMYVYIAYMCIYICMYIYTHIRFYFFSIQVHVGGGVTHTSHPVRTVTQF